MNKRDAKKMMASYLFDDLVSQGLHFPDNIPREDICRLMEAWVTQLRRLFGLSGGSRRWIEYQKALGQHSASVSVSEMEMARSQRDCDYTLVPGSTAPINSTLGRCLTLATARLLLELNAAISPEDRH